MKKHEFNAIKQAFLLIKDNLELKKCRYYYNAMNYNYTPIEYLWYSEQILTIGLFNHNGLDDRITITEEDDYKECVDTLLCIQFYIVQETKVENPLINFNFPQEN